MKQLPKENQFYYEKEGKWLAFNKERPDLGESKTYDDFLEVTSPSESELLEQRESQAKSTRDKAIQSNIEYDSVMWQVSDSDMVHFDDTIFEAEYAGHPPETTIDWILADNTVRATALSDLKTVKSLRAQRKQSIYAQYIEWRSGDKQTPFEPTL